MCVNFVKVYLSENFEKLYDPESWNVLWLFTDLLDEQPVYLSVQLHLCLNLGN